MVSGGQPVMWVGAVFGAAKLLTILEAGCHQKYIQYCEKCWLNDKA